MKRHRLVTGIQATGTIHVGNYFAALKPAVDRQDEFDCFIFIADLHALNSVTDAQSLNKNIIEVAKAYLAAGIDPEKVTLFQQSALPHTELATIISAQVGLGTMERAHAYKDARARGAQINYGLFSYPVLMAADILMYQGEVVPVGRDQQQHLEMTREIAERFHTIYGETFTLPQAVIQEIPTIPGLDGRKMSKSYGNVIGIFEHPDEITKKVMRIITDSKRPEEPKDPNTCTVFLLYSLVASEAEVAELRRRYTEGGIGYKEAKELLAEALCTYLAPIQARKAALDADDSQVISILKQGAEKALPIALETLNEVKTKVGLTLA